MTLSTVHEFHFLRETVVDVDAAVVGISSSRWMAISSSDATSERAQQIMKAHRFDILPISDGTSVREYFQTSTWNDYETIVRRQITHRDVIPMRSHISDVVRGFASDSRCFYFLAQERKVVGLVSVANLNCRPVKIYLFSLLCEFEMRLGAFITARKIPEQKLLSIVFGDTPKEKHLAVKKRYEADKAAGLDVPFVEYVYLPDMIKILKKTGLYSKFGYASTGKFEKAFNPLVALRNSVAHPVSPAPIKETAPSSLWKAINLIEGVLFELREA